MCGKQKPADQFGRNRNSRDGRLARCKTCDREVRLARYRNNPRVRAGFVWSAILQRVGNANGKNPSYEKIQTRCTREQFVAWYVAALPVFFAAYGTDATPSVDRIKPLGHYAIDNMQLIPLADNANKSPHKKNVHAPAGTAWCTHCREYLPRTRFYKNRAQAHGLQHSCKLHG